MGIRHLCLFVSSLLVVQDPKTDAREAFTSELQRLQARVELAPDVAVVRRELQALLDAHQDKDYVLARRSDLEVLAKACAFRAAVKTPEPKSLISGDFLFFDRAGGRIKVRYTPKTLADFGGVGTEREDTRSEGTSRVHPAVFSGPHTIEIRGKKYPDSGPGPVLQVCLAQGAGYHVIMGSAIKSSGGYDEWYAPTITYFSGEHHTDELDKKPLSPCKAGKPYTIRVQVTARQIQVLYNRQNQLQAKKKSAGFGQISFRAAPSDFDELVIEGRVEPSWLQRLEDASTQSQRAAFEKSFDLREHLPGWLLDATAAAGSVAKGQKAGAGEAAKEGDEARESSLVFPETLDQDAWKVVQRAFKIADSAKAIEFLRRQPEDALSPETRSYVLAFLHWQADQLAEAIVEADRACGARPDAAGSRWLRARILAEAGGRARALEDYQWVLQTELGRNPLVHVELVELLLRMGRFADAQRAMDKVQELGLTHEHLARTRQRLQKAMQGPTWARRFASASANYVVASDISEALCVQAAKVLEEGLALFETDLEQLPAATEKQQFRTFLFGGEVGYQAYCKDLGDDAPRHTAGLYYPGIKQLLIWNVPRREDMLRTVRHEGFHQYLDRLMADPPRWFNEGLAEYFEGVVQKGGRWNVGAVRRDHLDTLKANGPLRLPLAEFVQQGAAQFMANAPINYAQSWAFVHFLRHGPEQHRPLFQALWRALREGQTASQAMATVLPPGVLAGLQLEFDRYLWEAK